MKEKIWEAIAANPQEFPIFLARKLGVSEWEVVRELGEECVQEVAVECFDIIMQTVPEWGKITFIVANESVISETSSTLPPGKYAHGYYNFQHGESAIGGHIKKDELRNIAFVNRPHLKMQSLSVQFFDSKGNAMFKIFLGRDENKQILNNQKIEYLKLKEYLKNFKDDLGKFAIKRA